MNSHEHQPLKFPVDFLWGAATSAHQVEGGNNNNDWTQLGQGGFPVAGSACDHYHRYREDFDLAKSLNQNAHRFSIEWSRIEPSEGKWAGDELEHYKQVLYSLKERGLKPFVTLYHFTIPEWLSKKGGWMHKKSSWYFNRYVEYIVGELKDMADFWITINEPHVYVAQGFLRGEWPPFKRSFYQAMRVFFNLAKAHREAYKSIHRIKKEALVGIAQSVSSFHAYRAHNIFDQIFEMFLDFAVNHLFYRLSLKYHDFLGINYYLHYRIYKVRPHMFKGEEMFTDVARQHREMSDVGWEVYPQGIFSILIDLKDMGLPIYITENGIATENDHKRTRFIILHLKEIYHAIAAGVDIRGYFYWSLLDNYEWDKGFKPRFGLIEVDYQTFERRVRESARVYARICKENAISHDLLQYLGHQT